ncbi:MAG: hypothetical protein HQ519_13845 [Planctomycetes bacterium]|nr:hypothetical protein [Planctomycetota bacterium]
MNHIDNQLPMPRGHIWRVELFHCLFSGVLVFLVVILLPEVLAFPTRMDEGWRGSWELIMAFHVLVLSLVFLVTTKLKSLRNPRALGTISCIVSGMVAGGVEVVVLSVIDKSFPPPIAFAFLCGLGGMIGLVYRLCQNAYFNPVANG